MKEWSAFIGKCLLYAICWGATITIFTNIDRSTYSKMPQWSNPLILLIGFVAPYFFSMIIWRKAKDLIHPNLEKEKQSDQKEGSLDLNTSITKKTAQQNSSFEISLITPSTPLFMDDEFYICDNSISKSSTRYIYHSKSPRFFVRVIEFSDLNYIPSQEIQSINYSFTYKNGDNTDELYVFVLDNMIDISNLENIKQLLGKMAMWFFKVLNNEAIFHGFDPGEMYTPFVFHPQRPEVIAVEVEFAVKWIIMLPDFIKVFDKQDEMDKYLKNELRITDRQFDEGKVTMIN